MMSGHKINRKVYWARKLSPEMQALATEKCKGTDYSHLNRGTHICREHCESIVEKGKEYCYFGAMEAAGLIPTLPQGKAI